MARQEETEAKHLCLMFRLLVSLLKKPPFFILCNLASTAEISLFKATFLSSSCIFKWPKQLKTSASAQAAPQTNCIRILGMASGHLCVFKFFRWFWHIVRVRNRCSKLTNGNPHVRVSGFFFTASLGPLDINFFFRLALLLVSMKWRSLSSLFFCDGTLPVLFSSSPSLFCLSNYVTFPCVTAQGTGISVGTVQGAICFWGVGR